MNENINLVDILKKAPKGTKLWSPICGECELCKEDLTCKTFPIVCIGIDDGLEWHFKADGSFTENIGVECLLFPSKENRDWSTFKVFKKHKHFEPFQKVLVASGETNTWEPDIYRFYDTKNNIHRCMYYYAGSKETDIIPYEGNEDKLGKPVNE